MVLPVPVSNKLTDTEALRNRQCSKTPLNNYWVESKFGLFGNMLTSLTQYFKRLLNVFCNLKFELFLSWLGINSGLLKLKMLFLRRQEFQEYILV